VGRVPLKPSYIYVRGGWKKIQTPSFSVKKILKVYIIENGLRYLYGRYSYKHREKSYTYSRRINIIKICNVVSYIKRAPSPQSRLKSVKGPRGRFYV